MCGMKWVYLDKKVTPFGGMKLLKDFMDQTDIVKDLESVNLLYPQSNENTIQSKSFKVSGSVFLNVRGGIFMQISNRYIWYQEVWSIEWYL